MMADCNIAGGDGVAQERTMFVKELANLKMFSSICREGGGA